MAATRGLEVMADRGPLPAPMWKLPQLQPIKTYEKKSTHRGPKTSCQLQSDDNNNNNNKNIYIYIIYIHGLNLSEYLGINDQFLRPLQNHLELHIIYIYTHCI